MATIDIRAKTYCSLGEVISGNFSDTYAQGSGLIFTRGSVTLNGSIRPPVGSVVQFAYAKGGFIARFPRTLRVLSSFADPFRQTTKVELGCLLTFLENRKPPVEDPNSKEENDVPCYVYEKATLPISAKYVAEQILAAVGITSDPVPLTNYFSVDEFDLTPGFIQVLSDLLVSEGFIGYLDEQEVLRFKDLSEEVGSGPLIGGDQIIDIESIGVGDLPGDAVIVRYSSLKLKPPDELEDEENRAKRSWEWEETFGPLTTVFASYQDNDGNTQVASGTYFPYNFTATIYDVWDRAIERYSLTDVAVAEVNNRWTSDRAKAGQSISVTARQSQTTKWTYKVPAPISFQSGLKGLAGTVQTSGVSQVKFLLALSAKIDTDPASECLNPKPDGYEEVISEVTETFISEAELAGTLNIDSYEYEGQIVSFGRADIIKNSSTRITYQKDEASGITKTNTSFSKMYGQTTSGQQDLATRASVQPEFTGFFDFATWILELTNASGALRYVGNEVRIRTEREFGLQRRPSQAERNNTYNQKPQVTEQKAEVTWITGSTESTNYIEFTMPYAPDDKISWSEATGYTSTPSDAAAKALKFGRVQNRLLLGNRSGVSLQLPVELMPQYPFDPLYLQADGLTAQYRVNGANFTFDDKGIVASADCLFWGATGQEAA